MPPCRRSIAVRHLLPLLFLLLLCRPAEAQTSDMRCGPDLYRPGIILSSSAVCGAVYSQHVQGVGRLHLGVFHALQPDRKDAGAGRVINLTAGSFYSLGDDLAGFADYGMRFENGRAALALYNDLIRYIGDDRRFFVGYEGVRFLHGFDRGYDSLHAAVEQKFRSLEGRLVIDVVGLAYWTRKGAGPAADSFAGFNPWIEATYQPWSIADTRWLRVMRLYVQVAAFTGQPQRNGLTMTSFAGIRTSF